MKGDLLIGGGFFTHEKLSFGDLIRKDKDFIVRTINLKKLLKPRIRLEGDYVVLLGLKGMERMLRKNRFDKNKIHNYLLRFVDKTVPKNKPLIVVDDWSIPMLSMYGNKLRKYILDNFNVKIYFLREYLISKKYPKNVISFTLPCNDNNKLIRPISKKTIDIFFQGNISDKDRSDLFGKVKEVTKKHNCRYKTMTGGVKNVKDRLTEKEFLKVMSRSKLSLHFKGSGYDCYRYHEIASVGSIIVTPKYPWFVRNDYKDMESYILYNNVKELKEKINRVLGSDTLLSEMQSKSIDNFNKYHTCEARHREFKQFIEDYI